MCLALLAVFGIRASDPTLEFARAIERKLLSGDEVAAAQAAAGATQTKTKAKAGSKPVRSAVDDRLDVQPHVSLPTPRPSGDEITRIIVDAANEFGVSADYMLSIAECESTFNPDAYHPAGYHGLFQFDFPTWGDFGYGSIYDPVAQARTTARLIKAGESHRWPVCGS
jgi:soluble lytic murein transglycosylase-like protein